MKKWVVLFFICSLVSISPQTTISPEFSDLKGMEDQQGNTHLFYRIYSYYSDNLNFIRRNDVYHLDVNSASDTLLFEDYSIHNIIQMTNRIVDDYDFWNKNPNQFIYCGAVGGDPDLSAYIERFDGFSNYNALGMANSIQISRQDDSLVFAGTDASGINGLDATVKSTDGGWNWTQVSDTYEFLSLNPFNDQVLFAQDLYSYSLFKSADYGNTFIIVDTSIALLNDQFSYDQDGNHFNRILRNYYSGKYEYKVSPNQGSAFSWQTRYSSDSKIFISNDESVSGTIYLADKKNIFISTNYGNDFSLYKTLDRKIVGIYKKPNSNKIYAATKYKIVEITPDTIQVIKSLPVPEEVLNYYPLAAGNKWVFHHSTVTYDPYPNYSYQIDVKEVLGDTIAPNGKHYYKVNDETIWESSVLERIDSIEGKVYRYYEDASLPESEYLAYDLLAEIGDTNSSYRMGFNSVEFTTMYAESVFDKWGMTKPKKVFEEYTLHPPIFSLTQDIGLDSIYFYFDFGDTWITLKGCIINGVVYGDTTVVSVEDDETPIATSFKLEQNYPNPFNPTTKIKFTIPNVETHRDASLQMVTLKVYDVLGNEIATLVNEDLSAGEYEVEFLAIGLTSGIYFYQLLVSALQSKDGKAGSFIQTKKMILLR